ncbi:hypothetical protein Bca52824_033923 [Brassica carinata]|uniref:DUF1985 domain-containing protein n=1 Tax=Brassica carinata TaxID=52824 RepID=A0A8X7SFD4_BRACI|nr:hypothetical protein Bca52824_033923 [Brassica carinata]
MEGSKKMMKRPMKEVYGSDAAEGFKKGKNETEEHYRSLLRIANEHRQSENKWNQANNKIDGWIVEEGRDGDGSSVLIYELELSKGMFSTGKLVEVTRKIGEKEVIWVQSFVLKEIQGGDKREFLVKRCTSSHHLNDDGEEITTAVDICNVRPSPPRDLFAKYELQDIVEVFVGNGWRKGEIHSFMNFQREFEKEAHTNVATPQMSNISTTYVLETNDDDIMSDAPTEITIPQKTANNTHDMDDGTTKDVEPPNITPRNFCQETPIGETMSNSDDAIVLPKRVFEPGAENRLLGRTNKRCSLKLVGKVEKVLGKEFKRLEDTFLGPIIKMGRREKDMAFSRNLIHQLFLWRIITEEKGLWFSFGEQSLRFSLIEFYLATGLPYIIDGKEEEEKRFGDEQEEQEEILGTKKKKKKDPWMKKNQTVKSLLDLLVKDSKKLTADQRLRLGATILKITTVVLERAQYGIPGFIYAIQLWALSSVDQLGTFFGDKDDETQFPLCLHWIKNKSPTMEEVTKIDSNKKINIAVAEAEVVKNNYGPGLMQLIKTRLSSSLSRQETENQTQDEAEQQVEPDVDVEDSVKLQRKKRERVNKSAKREFGDDENLLSYMIAQKQQNTKEQSQDEEQQVEDDIEVDDGDKERETSKSIEVQTHNEEEQREEGDVEVEKTVQPQRKKRRRGKKGTDASTSKSKKQKLPAREVLVDDVIGNVLEDLNLKAQKQEEEVDEEEARQGDDAEVSGSDKGNSTSKISEVS